MKIKLISICWMLYLYGCSDGIDKDKHVNFSDNPKYQQMVAAANNLPQEADLDRYRHFHIIGDIKSERRMIHNLHETLMKPDINIVSIGCDNPSTCSAIVASSLRIISEKEVRRSDLTIMLPGYMPSPPEVNTIGAAVIRYEIPSLKDETSPITE